VTADLPWAAVGKAYSAPIETTADPRCLVDGGIALTVSGGELPHGFLLGGGTISGITNEIGIFHFVVRAGTSCAAVVKEFCLTVSCSPILRVVPEQLIFDYHTGEPDPKEQTILVASTWAALPYQLTKRNNAPWLDFSQRRGSTPERGSAFSADTVTVRVNPGKLTPGTYNETIQVSAWQGANAPIVTVTLKVF
jgi:hypothetical protein